MVAVALPGLITLKNVLKSAGTLKRAVNVSLRSIISSRITGNSTEASDEPAANVAVKELDTKSTPPPTHNKI